MRQSISPTYDSRKTGHRFSIRSAMGGEEMANLKLPDPFVHHRIKIHWWDAIKCLLKHGRIDVEVVVSGDMDIVEDVMELDADYLGHGNTRRHEWNASIEQALSDAAKEGK